MNPTCTLDNQLVYQKKKKKTWLLLLNNGNHKSTMVLLHYPTTTIKKYFSCFTFLNVTLYLNRTTNRNCKDKCVSHVSVRIMFFSIEMYF